MWSVTIYADKYGVKLDGLFGSKGTPYHVCLSSVVTEKLKQVLAGAD